MATVEPLLDKPSWLRLFLFGLVILLGCTCALALARWSAHEWTLVYRHLFR